MPLHIRPRLRHGFSLVELLIATTIGLWLMLGAIQLIGHHLASHRAQVRELRLNQELRAAAEVMARDLKRAGHWDKAFISSDAPEVPRSPQDNPFALATPDSRTALNSLEYGYERTLATAPDAFGFRHQVSGGVGMLRMKNAAGGWQPLTDPSVVNITQFQITPFVQTIELWTSCTCRFSPHKSPDCDDTALQEHPGRPRLHLHHVEVVLTGVATGDSDLSRTVRESIHIGNQVVAHPAGCPDI